MMMMRDEFRPPTQALIYLFFHEYIPQNGIVIAQLSSKGAYN